MKKVILLLAIVFSLSACQLNGLYSDYSKLTDKEKESVKKAEGPLEGLTADGNVYQVRVDDVRKYLASQEKTVVYMYKASCSSPDCILPSEAEQICEAAGVDICLIATGFNQLFLKTMKYRHPVFVIDEEAFNTRLQDKYSEAFTTELTGQGDLGDGRFYTFVRGKYAGNYKSCKEAAESLK